ncbi:MAG: hisA/hisF family protein [Planctomycetes bacterium]|nr:hisA/hisF family protein [Planctomycetota bacterium]
MRVLPVLDLMQGVVVRGVAGRRETYRPIESRVAASSEPLDVAWALRETFGFRELYVADLDAIVDDRPNLTAVRALAAEGFEVWVDAGVRDAARARAVLDAGAARAVAGLETLPGPRVLRELFETLDAGRLVFSLDLNNGRPLAVSAEWQESEPLAIAEEAIAAGARQMIVLDLAAVGTGGGVPTLELCRQFRRRFPDLSLVTGGGVRGVGDLVAAAEAGVDGLLVASALHDGRLTPADLAASNRPT